MVSVLQPLLGRAGEAAAAGLPLALHRLQRVSWQRRSRLQALLHPQLAAPHTRAVGTCSSEQ